MEVIANGSRLIPSILNFAYEKGVKKVVMHPTQKVALEEIFILQTPAEVYFLKEFEGVKLEPNILVPEDQVWLVGEDGSILSTIKQLAVPVIEEL